MSQPVQVMKDSKSHDLKKSGLISTIQLAGQTSLSKAYMNHPWTILI